MAGQSLRGEGNLRRGQLGGIRAPPPIRTFGTGPKGMPPAGGGGRLCHFYLWQGHGRVCGGRAFVRTQGEGAGRCEHERLRDGPTETVDNRSCCHDRGRTGVEVVSVAKGRVNAVGRTCTSQIVQGRIKARTQWVQRRLYVQRPGTVVGSARDEGLSVPCWIQKIAGLLQRSVICKR